MRKLLPILGLLVLVVMVACRPAPTPEATDAPEPTEAMEATEEMEETEEPMEEEAMLPDLGGREVTIAVDNAYLPFNFIRLDTGEAQGWDYDFINEACARLNCVPVWIEFGWDTMIASVAEGQFDMATDGITITEERGEIVDFSNPYVKIEQRLLVRVGEDRFTDADSLAADSSLLVGSQIGTTNYEKAEEIVGDDRIQLYDDFGLIVQALIAGDVDAVVIDEVAGLGYQGANSDSVELIGPSLESDALGLIFTKGSELTHAFNEAMASMIGDGTLQEINQKWFGPDFEVTYDDIDCGAYCPEPLGTEDNPLIWVLVPSQDTEAVLTGAEEIAAAIEDATGLIVVPLVTTDFTGAVEAMCNGEAHLGALNTFNYVLASARECADVAVASARFGSTFYSGQVVAHVDSGITSVADLAGATFCRPDPTSTSGWVIPSIAMQAEGLDPEVDLADIIDAGGHDAAILGVLDGTCQAAASFVDARSLVDEDFPEVYDTVIVITESAPIPNDNISFHPDVPSADVDAITQVFLDLAASEEGLAILNSVYSWSGMEVVDDSFYDGFRQQLEAAGLSIEDLIGD